jgi:nucleoside-diphosphate-sugar epimerase
MECPVGTHGRGSKMQIVIGAGYTGGRLAAGLAAHGSVIAITSAAGTAAALAGRHLDARAWDLDASARCPLTAAEVAGAFMYYLAPPPDGGDGDPRLAACLASLPARPQRIVYLSTTGVYGDAGGATVTEDDPVVPSNERSRRRLAAERTLREWCEPRGVEWLVLRVPGIYGPGRLPLERLRRGDPVIVESEAGPGNRIHVDDLVACCMAAAGTPHAANRVYNVGDGDHASTSRYFELVAKLAGLPAPPHITRAEAQQRLSPGLWSFMADSRRVDTARMRHELGVTPRWGKLEDGIRDSLARR